MIKAIFALVFVLGLSHAEFTCPESSDEFKFYADPEDCAGYYECHQGFVIHLKCPVGYYWNQGIENCDLEENVSCESLSTVNPASNPTTVKPPPTAWTSDSPVTQTVGPTGSPPPFDCPIDTPEIIFFADPENCAGFYECYAGILSHYTCSGVLVFNPETDTCDYPENVDCGGRSTIKPTGGPTNSPTDGPTNQPPVTNPPDMQCPESTPEVIYYSDPEDCAKFYECYNGLISHLTCEAEHLWNPLVNYCDFIENVDCGDRPQH